MHWDRLTARRLKSVARQSGISVKRLDDKSRIWSVFANGAKLVMGMVVRSFSARLRCRRNRHFDTGAYPKLSRFEALLRGVLVRSVDPELPDDRRTFGVPLLEWLCEDE
jgi:hypothetical protein